MNADTLNEISQLKADNALLAQALAEWRAERLKPARGSAEHRAQLWDAINEYAEACGGTPGERIYGNTKRQRTVSEIEALVYPLNAEREKLNLKSEPFQGYCQRCGLPKTANCDCWNPNNET